MKLRTTFWGNDMLFEGDLPLTLRALPIGSKVTKATITLTPVIATDQTPAQQFHERLLAAAGAPNLNK